MRRVIGVTAMAVALAVVLSGCSLWQDGEKVVGQVREGIVARQLLDELTGELRARDDVESADSNVVPVYMTANVTVEFRDTASASAIAEVTTRVDEALRSGELQPFTREFSVQAGDAGIRQASFDSAPIDYSAELAYWDAVQSAIGAGITLTLGADRAGEFQRILSTETDATVATIADHYDALTALEPPDAAETRWRLPGVVGYADWLGALPERGLLAFLASMAGMTNLLDDSVQEPPPGVTVDLAANGSFLVPSFAVVTNPPDADSDPAAEKPLVLAAVRAAIGTGLPSFRFYVVGATGGSPTLTYLHLGECTEAVPPTPADRKLVAELAADGILLPEGAAGLCLTFATP